MTKDKYHPIPGEMDVERVRETLKNYLKTNRIIITDTGYQDELKETILGEQAISRLRYLEIEKLKEKLGIALTALLSISKNTCCDKCREAALVANSTLIKIGEVK